MGQQTGSVRKIIATLKENKHPTKKIEGVTLGAGVRKSSWLGG